MNRTALRLSALEPADEEREATIAVSSPTTGVAVVDVSVRASPQAAPLHWRAGDWTKPPLDISLAADGHVEHIQFVFQDERPAASDASPAHPTETGIPRFMVEGWPDDRFVDAHAPLRAVRTPDGELVIAVDEVAPARVVGLGEGLRLGLGADDQLVQVMIGPLDDAQWQAIERAAPEGA